MTGARWANAGEALTATSKAAWMKRIGRPRSAQIVRRLYANDSLNSFKCAQLRCLIAR
jgi:hypothetical protein